MRESNETWKEIWCREAMIKFAGWFNEKSGPSCTHLFSGVN